MNRRIKISDVARSAGVSTATVDRVLNARDGVSERAAESVRLAVESLGYGKLPDHLNTGRQRSYRVVLLLPKIDSGFIIELQTKAIEIASTSTQNKMFLSTRRIGMTDGSDLIAELSQLNPVSVDAVILFAIDVPGAKLAIDDAVARGLKVCTIVSDVPSSNRSFYVGQDNVIAGRVAGRLIGMMTPDSGKIAIVAGSNQIRDHMERNMGLIQTLKSRHPGLTILDPFEGDSESRRNRRYIIDCCKEHPDLVGVYCSGGGVSGVIQGLETTPKKLAFVAHELTETTRNALINGTADAILNQNSHEIMARALKTMRDLLNQKPLGSTTLKTEIYFADNLP